jgi:choline dehydrogenase-like flavoprotein
MGQIFKENNDNEVYDGLYVVDASIIPTPLGVNHLFTMSTLAFRIAEKLLAIKSTCLNKDHNYLIYSIIEYTLFQKYYYFLLNHIEKL